jgi:hypothetical protein
VKPRQTAAQAHFNKQEWTLEEIEPAWAKSALCFRSGGEYHFGHGDGEERCRSLSNLAGTLMGLRARFNNGADIELLTAIALCAEENLPMPAWAADAFLQRFRAYVAAPVDKNGKFAGRMGGRPSSLDEAFLGASAPATPAKLDTRRRDWTIGIRLWTHVRKHAAEHTGLTGAVESALRELNPGVGRSKALELVQWVEDVYATRPDHKPLNLQFRRIRRTQPKR